MVILGSLPMSVFFTNFLGKDLTVVLDSEADLFVFFIFKVYYFVL